MHRPLNDDTSDHDHEHPHGHEGERADPSGGRPFYAGIRRGLGFAALLALVALIAARTIFFVDETQYVYVTQFGKPVRLYIDAGLGVKWPHQSLWPFDRRLQIFEPPPREILTEDKENLDFSWYVCWRIPDRSFAKDQLSAAGRSAEEQTDKLIREQMEIYVRRFLQSVGAVTAAENRLEERIQAAIAAEIGKTRLTQLVSLDAGQLQLAPLAARVTDAIRLAAAEQFGIEIVDIRLKRFSYPEAVKPAVFAEIRSERERVAVQHRADGASQKTKIESLAALQRYQLLAQAEREATRLRGEGEAKSMEILNAAHSKNPEFYELLKLLETYRSILDEQTTVVLSADSPLLKLLTEGLPPLANPPARAPSSTTASTAKQTTASSPAKPEGPDSEKPGDPPLHKEAGP